MNYNTQALTSYKETKIKTASQGSLIIMLYDEGIKQITFALEKMSEAKMQPDVIESVHMHILKAQDVITELMVSLDMDAGGEISANLLSLYSFFNQQLFHANMQKDAQPLISVRDMMEELRIAWLQVVNSSAAVSANKPAVAGINIAG